MSASELRERINAIMKGCREPNWDSYGAHEVTSATCDIALLLVEAIPDGWYVTATPEGCIQFADERGGAYHTIEVNAITAEQLDVS